MLIDKHEIEHILAKSNTWECHPFEIYLKFKVCIMDDEKCIVYLISKKK